MFWLASTSLVALTLHYWEVGTYQEIRTNPKVLDLGLSSLSCMAFREEDYEKKLKDIVHMKFSENALLNNPGTKRAVSYLQLIVPTSKPVTVRLS